MVPITGVAGRYGRPSRKGRGRRQAGSTASSRLVATRLPEPYLSTATPLRWFSAGLRPWCGRGAGYVPPVSPLRGASGSGRGATLRGQGAYILSVGGRRIAVSVGLGRIATLSRRATGGRYLTSRRPSRPFTADSRLGRSGGDGGPRVGPCRGGATAAQEVGPTRPIST